MSDKLVQRASARRDILAIVDHIADDNPAAAEAVYEAYEYSLELLKATPDMGRLYPSANPRLSGIRFITLPRYLQLPTFFRVRSMPCWLPSRRCPSVLSHLEPLHFE